MKTDFTLLTLSENFPDEESCIRYFEKMRWGDKVISPYDATSKVYKCKNGKYKCKNTGRYFDVKTGTAFAKTKMPMRKWFSVMLLLLTHKRGISSCQVASILKIKQRTAWGMMQKVRQYMSMENNHKLSGEVEIDETFVGGKNKNRHKDKKVEKCQGRSYKDKVPVFGILERDGKVIARVVPNTQCKTLVPIIKECVEEGSVVYTDGWDYNGLHEKYEQRSVDHENHFYGTTYATDEGEIIVVSTNGIENVWSHFKRMILGVYYHVSKNHMQEYVDEYIFRFNTRNYTDSQRFNLLLRNIA